MLLNGPLYAARSRPSGGADCGPCRALRTSGKIGRAIPLGKVRKALKIYFYVQIGYKNGCTATFLAIK